MSWLFEAVQSFLGCVYLQCIQYVLIPIVLIWISITLWDWLICQSRDKSCDSPLPPGSSGLPFIGETLQFIFAMIFHSDFYNKRQAKYQTPMYRTHILGKPTIRVTDIALVREILRHDDIKIKPGLPKSVSKLIGEDSLVMAKNPRHSKMKTVLSSAFSQNAINSYIPEIVNIVKEYVSKWCQQERVVCYEECQQMSASLAWQVILGSEVPMFDTMRDYFGGFFGLPINLPGFSLYKAMKARGLIKREADRILRSNTSSCTTILDWVRHTEPEPETKGIDMTDLPNEMLFAAYATTSSALTSTIMLLGQNPDVVDRLRNEFSKLGLDDPEKQLDYKILNEVALLRNVVEEVLRMCPPAGAMFKEASKTFVVGGYQIPKGWRVALAIKESQQLNPAYKNISQFDPDRWENLRNPGDRSGDILSFGSGGRLCLGKNYALTVLYVCILQLVNSCRWNLLNPNPTMERFPVLHSVDGLPCQFKAL